MRADRLVSLVLLLRQRGRMSAATLAAELEVSTRTVLRDIEALSTAGVPVFAERGRHGGFELLPGFRSELTGLTHDEALALLIAGSRRGAQAFGLGSALASAMLKVTDALPASYRDAANGAAARLLLDPEIDLLARRHVVEEVDDDVVTCVRRAVLDGRRVRLRYAAADTREGGTSVDPGRTPSWQTIDPVGLVTVRGLTYLLATRDGADRTYRLSRVVEVDSLDEPARREALVDLEQVWQERSRRFRHDGAEQVVVRLTLAPYRLTELVGTALHVSDAVPPEVGDGVHTGSEDRLHLEATFQDARHAEWAVWQLATDGEVLEPLWLRDAVRERAAALAARYRHG